jgi:membrane protease subunit HflC
MSGGLIRTPMVLAVLALALLFVLFNTVFIVPEASQAVILRLGNPVYTINAWRRGEQFGHTQAGPWAKVPFLEEIVWVDKRVRDIDLEGQPVLSTDQLRLEVDAFARYRVVDPITMVRTAGNEERVADQLKPILGAALRNELGKRKMDELLSPERGEVMHNIRAGLQRIASQYGVQIVDVRIKQAELPSGTPLESAFERMRSARQQEVTAITAQGQKQAQIIQAEADATAAQIYANSFNKDPAFYDFYRAMQSYRTTFIPQAGQTQGETSIVLSPQNGYLRQFENR